MTAGTLGANCSNPPLLGRWSSPEIGLGAGYQRANARVVDSGRKFAPMTGLANFPVGHQGHHRSTLPGASWQRCRTHAARNLLTKVPKSPQAMAATLGRTIFEQPDHEQVWAQHARVADQPANRFPDAAIMLTDMASDPLAFSTFPTEHWTAIGSNKPQERLNKELRRRTDVVRIFPNRAAVVHSSVRCPPSSTTSEPSPVARCVPRASPGLGSSCSPAKERRCRRRRSTRRLGTTAHG